VKNRIVVGIASLLLAGGIASAALAQQLPNMSTTLAVTPESYEGTCPVTIRFKGTINTSLPGRIHYKFVRSDGAYMPTEPAVFGAAGAQAATTNWTVGTGEQSRYEGWMMLKIVYPGEMESPRARYKVTCTGMNVDLPDLTIEDVALDDQCRVLVKAKNNGPGAVFDEVWTDHRSDSPAIKLYVNGKPWGSETLWLLDPHRSLKNQGGTVVYTSNLKVRDTQEIRATIDGTHQVKEKDETNNEKKVSLTCKPSGPEKQE
jgi:hypothetical protein